MKLAVLLSKDAYETLTRPGDVLIRPQVVKTSMTTFAHDLRKAAGDAVQFNVLMGRNILTRMADKINYVEQALTLLHPQGTMVLAEIVPQNGQRLSALQGMSRLEHGFFERFLQVETAMFNDVDDPMLNWNAETLKNILEAIPDIGIKTVVVPYTAHIRIPAATIDFWFRMSPDTARESLGNKLKKDFTAKEIVRLRTFFHTLLDNQEVMWKSMVVFIKVTKLAANTTPV
jgi:putative ATPase